MIPPHLKEGIISRVTPSNSLNRKVSRKLHKTHGIETMNQLYASFSKRLCQTHRMENIFLLKLTLVEWHLLLRNPTKLTSINRLVIGWKCSGPCEAESRCRLSRVHNWPGVLGIWNGEGMGRKRSVYEQPGAKVDGIAPRKRRDSK